MKKILIIFALMATITMTGWGNIPFTVYAATDDVSESVESDQQADEAIAIETEESAANDEEIVAEESGDEYEDSEAEEDLESQPSE